MKKLFLSCVVALSGLLASQASAQINNCCPAPCDYNPCCDTGGFRGFYFGGNLGVFSHTAYRTDLDGVFEIGQTFVFNSTGFTAGLQLGYDWQCNSKLLGFVVDWNWANPRRHHDSEDEEIGSFRIRSRHNWFTTLRFRAGLTLCDALIYVTGGAAVARHRTNWFFTDFIDTTSSSSRWGWTAGAGVEYIVGCNWSVGLDFLYLQFANRRHSDVAANDDTFHFAHDDSSWTTRLLVNYRFGNLCCY